MHLEHEIHATLDETQPPALKKGLDGSPPKKCKNALMRRGKGVGVVCDSDILHAPLSPEKGKDNYSSKKT